MGGKKIMRTYEPRWSAEEQTMVDLMALNGWAVEADINEDYTRINLIPNPPIPTSYQFTADTEYEAIRKAFNFWNKRNEN